MDTPNTITIIVAVVTTLGGGWQYLSNRRLSKDNREKEEQLASLERHKVEAQAYDKARAHYDAIIEDLMAHVDWLKSELAERTAENSALKERISALEKTIEMLRSANVIVIEGEKK